MTIVMRAVNGLLVVLRRNLIGREDAVEGEGRTSMGVPARRMKPRSICEPRSG